MASASSKTDQIVDEKLEEKKEIDDDIKLDAEEITMTYNTIVSEEKPESEDVSIVEGLEKNGKIKDSETLEKANADSNPPTRLEVHVKDLEDETGMPEEQKKESSGALVPDATEDDDLNVPTSAEVSVIDLRVQSAFPEEQKQEKTIQTQEPGSNGAIIDSGGETVQSSSHEEKGSGDAEAFQKKEVTENPVETLEAKAEVAQNSTHLSTAQVSSDQGRAPETAEIVVEEKDMRFNIDKEGIEATVNDLNIVPEAIEVLSEDKEVSASDERKSESLKDVDASSVTVEESPEQVIEENKTKSSKNDKVVPAETSNDFETPEFAAEVMKDIGSSEMAEEKKNDSKEQSVVEENVQIPYDKKEETQIDEAIQIATDKSEKKKLGEEKEESEKPKDVVDPIVSSDTADAKLIKEPTKRESNNLLSKVKRSIVKAKKAILGKSPGPKIVSSEIKNDNS